MYFVILLCWIDSCWANSTRLQVEVCGRTRVETAVSRPLCVSCAVKVDMRYAVVEMRVQRFGTFRNTSQRGGRFSVNKLRVGLHFYGGGRLSMSCMEWQFHVLSFFFLLACTLLHRRVCRWCICISPPSPECAGPRTFDSVLHVAEYVFLENKCTYATMETYVAMRLGDEECIYNSEECI